PAGRLRTERACQVRPPSSALSVSVRVRRGSLITRCCSRTPVRTCTRAGSPERPGPRAEHLLEGDLGALGLELGLGLLRVVLVGLLQDRLRRGLDQVLGLLQAQTGQLADDLDDLDLLATVALEDDVELVLLLLRLGGGGATGRTGGGDRHRSGGLDVEGLLELLHELGELDQRHLLERLKEFGSAQLRHDGSAFLSYSLIWLLVGRSRPTVFALVLQGRHGADGLRQR